MLAWRPALSGSGVETPGGEGISASADRKALTTAATIAPINHTTGGARDASSVHPCLRGHEMNQVPNSAATASPGADPTAAIRRASRRPGGARHGSATHTMAARATANDGESPAFHETRKTSDTAVASA
jgi:hypothetical protein